MNHTKEAERKLKLSTNKLKSNLRQLNVCVIKLPEKRREMREIQTISEMLTSKYKNWGGVFFKSPRLL